MKSASLLFLMFLVAACSGYPEEVPTAEGVVLDPQPVTGEELKKINTICSALRHKTDTLRYLIGSTLNFRYAEKGCSRSEFDLSTDVQARIVEERGDYYFRSLMVDFPFPEIETTHKGIMRDICGASELTSPLETSAGRALFFSTVAGSRLCPSDDNQICLYVGRGVFKEVRNDAPVYTVHSREWISFKVKGERTGFVTSRWVQSSADCPRGQEIQKKMTLK